MGELPASREAVRRSRGVPGPLGHGGSSTAAAIAGVGWVAGADLVSGATLWKLGSRMLVAEGRAYVLVGCGGCLSATP